MARQSPDHRAVVKWKNLLRNKPDRSRVCATNIALARAECAHTAPMHYRLFVVGLFFFSGLLSSCLDSTPRNPTLQSTINQPEPKAAETAQAEDYLRAIEDDIQRFQGLPAREKYAAEAGLRSRLMRACELAAGTRLENKAVFFYANWRFAYDDGEGVDGLLNQLASLTSPALKRSGERLRVLLRLRQGKIEEAKSLAAPLIAEVPEYSPLQDVIAFYETVGKVAPTMSGTNANGGVAEPVTQRSENWLLYVFTDAVDDATIFLLQRYLSAFSALPTNERRIVCVTSEANLLAVTAKVRSLPFADQLEVLWINPHGENNVAAWRKNWKLPPQHPHTALLGPGPQRVIMGVQITPDTLGNLLVPAAANK
jgi:hypothetical protein